MGYGALAAADYFDSTGYTANPKIYSFKWGRNGWGDAVMAYTNTKPVSSGTVTDGSAPYTPDKNSSQGAIPADCANDGTYLTGTGAELVRCVGFGAIPLASSGLAAWLSPSDALYRLVDIRESGEIGSDVVKNNTGGSGGLYSLNIPYQDMFDAAGSYANLQNLNEGFSGTSKYVFYNKSQHTALAAAMGARMLGYDAIGLRDGLAGWNNTVGQPWSGDPDKVTVGVMTGQTTGLMYGGTIAAYYSVNSGLNLVPTITTGPSATVGTANATIAWVTNYPATTQINDKDTYNDTVLNTSHSATLTGLSCGTEYTVNAISYDCVANKVTSPITFTTAACQDLYVSSVTAPSSASPGSTITVAATVNKSGSGSAAASTARIYIYGNLLGTGNKFKKLGDVAVSSFGAGPGSDAVSAPGLTIPSWVVPGSHQIIVRADLNNDVPEWNESNNRRSVPITIVP